MDYAKLNTEALAKMVFTGSKQLDELPAARRRKVADILALLKADAEAAAEKKKKKKKAKKKE